MKITGLSSVVPVSCSELSVDHEKKAETDAVSASGIVSATSSFVLPIVMVVSASVATVSKNPAIGD
ncbi:MAG TPA: hypothetical protein PK765_02610 [bacterium]|nr:hypothetical protein [bacterium]